MARSNQWRSRIGSDGPERISPLFNDAFIRIFGGDTSRDATRGLINAILRPLGMEPIGKIERIDAEQSQYVGSIGCRTGRVDVCVISEGRVFDLEAQRFPEDIANRSVFYASQIICSNTHQGMGYDEIPQAVIITLLDAPSMFADSEDYLHVSSMQWNSAMMHEVSPCTDRMVFILVELEKIRRRYTSLTEDVLNDETLAWLYVLARGFEDEGETMKIADKFPTIEEFAEQYGIAIDDPELKAKYRAYDIAVKEYKSQQKYLARLRREAIEEGAREGREAAEKAEREGLAKGLEEGLAKGREEGMAKGREEGMAKGLEEGMAKGLEEGMAKGRKEGAAASRASIASAMRENGIDEETINRVMRGAGSAFPSD